MNQNSWLEASYLHFLSSCNSLHTHTHTHTCTNTLLYTLLAHTHRGIIKPHIVLDYDNNHTLTIAPENIVKVEDVVYVDSEVWVGPTHPVHPAIVLAHAVHALVAMGKQRANRKSPPTHNSPATFKNCVTQKFHSNYGKSVINDEYKKSNSN